MKTLVTGATGLLGNNVVRQLLEQGVSVRVLSRGKNRRELAGLDVEVCDGDVRDEEEVRGAVRGVERVVHSAAMVRIGRADEASYRAINVDGARNVARAARDEGARLVHVSTVNALGVGWRDRVADEEHFDPGIAACPYVDTKREADRCILDLTGEGLDAVIVRPGFLIGPWDWKPSSGEMLLHFAQRYLPVAPTGGLSVVDARDVASGVLAALDRGATGRDYILAGHNLTYRQVWRKFAATAGRWPPIFPAGPLFRIVGRIGAAVNERLTGREGLLNTAAMELGRQFHYFSSHRAEQELGYRFRPLDETIQGAWDWFAEHGYLADRSGAR